MLFHAKRLGTDLQQVRGWVVTIALTVAVVSVLTTYMAVFAAAEARSGALAATPPREDLGFLRVIDPGESIVTFVDSLEDLERSVLDEPGPAVLLDRMSRDDRMFVTLPLNAYLPAGSEVDSPVRAVLGQAPPFLDEAPRDGVALLWGSLGRSSDGSTTSPVSIGGHQVHAVGDEPPAGEYIAGNGRRTSTSHAALVAVDVPTGRDLGVMLPHTVSDVIGGFTCYCDPAELAGLAGAMSDAEERAATGRTYYAVGYEGLMGPVQRSRALTEVLSTGHAVATLLSVWCLVVISAQVLWARRRRAYLVERLCGSSEFAIQVRGQLLVALSLTLPALAGYELVNALLGTGGWPPPLPSEARIVALVGIGILHASAGALTAVRIHVLCQPSGDEVRHV